MISYLTGKAIKDGTILTVSGIGFLVQTTVPLVADKEISLHITTRVSREGEWSLFGFTTSEEQAVFEQLIKVQGVGPSLGIQILREVGVGGLCTIISNKDEKSLRAIKGVGAKVAKSLITLFTLPDNITHGQSSDKITEELIQAVVNLGFSEEVVSKVVKSLSAEELNNDGVIASIINQVLVAEDAGRN